ncbi:hypothetical protein [Lactobacillus taiwanensis]|uniref:hypothetical protein n=1 Tax=Lactobacillus taiwanensis TaxID=508451 RepID=UPI001AEBDEAA|nr:hypothetical protein [Lactobacillus taiwanensis]QTQ39310.1 hypothetical protein H1A07_05455 [Lactobacillus taiwanensis]
MNVISTIIAGISLVWTIFNSVNQSKSSKKILEYKKEVDKSNVTLKNIELKYEKAQNVISEMATKCMVLPYLNLDINKSRIYLMGETANIEGKEYPQFFIKLKFKNVGTATAANINLMPLKKEPNLNEYIDTEYSSNFHVVYQFMEPNSLFVNDTASCIITIDFDKYSKDVSRKRSTKYNNSISFKVRYTDITGRKYYQAYTLVYDVEIHNGKISNKYPLTQNYTVYPPKEIKD